MEREQHLPLAPRDLLILSVLAEGPSHGYGIIKAIETRSQSGVFLDPANLYRVLRRMTRMGWIRQGQPPEGPGTGDHSENRRKTYEITVNGRALLAAELARLERLLEFARPALAEGPGGPGAGVSSHGGSGNSAGGRSPRGGRR